MSLFCYFYTVCLSSVAPIHYHCLFPRWIPILLLLLQHWSNSPQRSNEVSPYLWFHTSSHLLNSCVAWRSSTARHADRIKQHCWVGIYAHNSVELLIWMIVFVVVVVVVVMPGRIQMQVAPGATKNTIQKSIILNGTKRFNSVKVCD